EALGEKEGGISVVVTHVPAGAGSVAAVAPNFLRNDHIKLVVSDTGTGMREEVQAKIFDPFFTTKFAGRGLGLAAVQGIIRHHGGVIRVASAPDRGSCFEVMLPCTSQAARDACDNLVRTSPGENGRVEGTVLVIEDEDILRLAVSKMLRRRGFFVIEAGDGRAGLDLLRCNEKIDVVLLDLTMPGVPGREVLEELQRVRPGVKVIVTTAYSQDSAVTALKGQQPWLYIRKPYRISELVQSLQNALSAQAGERSSAKTAG